MGNSHSQRDGAFQGKPSPDFSDHGPGNVFKLRTGGGKEEGPWLPAHLGLLPWGRFAQMALDGLSTAIFVLDAERQIGLVNQAGRQMLAGKGRLCLSDGRLSARVPAEATRLARAVQQVCDGHSRYAAMLLDAGMQHPPLQIVISRAGAPAEIGPKPVWLLVLAGPASPSPPDVAIVQMMFGLTPREAQTVADLGQGCSLEESAQRRNVAVSTVRSQLTSALAKTQARTQARLMLMLRALPALSGLAVADAPVD